jgi:hypothetical protein
MRNTTFIKITRKVVLLLCFCKSLMASCMKDNRVVIYAPSFCLQPSVVLIEELDDLTFTDMYLEIHKIYVILLKY